MDGGFVGGGAFGGNTRLLGVRPTLLALPAKPSPAAGRGGGGALGYCVGQSAATAASGRDRNAVRGVGVGGSPQLPRLALDDMFETLTLRRCALAGSGFGLSLNSGYGALSRACASDGTLPVPPLLSW